MTRTDGELVALANENFVASFRKVAEHGPAGATREFGGVFAFASGLPHSLFNGCVVVEPATVGDLDAAVRWVAARHVPYRVFVAAELEPELAEVTAAHGLERDPVPYPGMVLSPIPDSPEPPASVRVAHIDDAGRDAFLGVGVASGLPRDLAEALFSRSFLGDDDVEAFVGLIDDRPVGCSLAIRSVRAAGVYSVETLPSARRRGVGTAMTWAAVAAGRFGGLDCAVLQSSEMAVSMYEAMGFRTVAPYVVFKEPKR